MGVGPSTGAWETNQWEHPQKITIIHLSLSHSCQLPIAPQLVVMPRDYLPHLCHNVVWLALVQVIIAL